ncbi:hypothetical protein SBA5_490035 [Candidatus Sulfotelmatomonas gaucii]|uniref:Uncharacterized protein n=1 Tax=Candidatus Sulfuritelmatomonas gaucii TaxID=2043161 RepID=A0A2N9LPU0_9BACT|nr:hypothetical protein SBA5_490035 [Candidatus Sulfotelmatomonas gaucii]
MENVTIADITKVSSWFADRENGPEKQECIEVSLAVARRSVERFNTSPEDTGRFERTL